MSTANLHSLQIVPDGQAKLLQTFLSNNCFVISDEWPMQVEELEHAAEDSFTAIYYFTFVQSSCRVARCVVGRERVPTRFHVFVCSE